MDSTRRARGDCGERRDRAVRLQQRVVDRERRRGGRARGGRAGRILSRSAGDAAPANDGASDDGPPFDAAVPDAGESVLMHHKHWGRDGMYVEPTLTRSAAATTAIVSTFHAVLPDPADEVYAQPLFVDGAPSGTDMVIVATEANNVYALDATTGAQLWHTNLGPAVPRAALQTCGDLDTYGVTGTPVIDFASRRLYLDAVTFAPDGGASVSAHQVFALSIDTGLVVSGWPVDVAAAVTSTTFMDDVQGQRGALALLGGTLYVPFGGLFGDCGNHHGVLLAISVADPSHVSSWATTAIGGGVWGPSGVATDGTNVFVNTGNTAQTTTWAGGEAILSFPAGAPLGTPSYFSPLNWHDLDNFGQDLGGTGPLLIDLPGSTPSKLVLALGLDGKAYLLDRTSLPGIGVAIGAPDGGSSAATANVAFAPIISAPALYTTATATYVVFKGPTSCGVTGSHQAIKILPGSPPTIAPAWCVATGGTGSPIVTTTDGSSEAVVWIPGAEGDHELHAYDGDTGAVIANVAIPLPVVADASPEIRRYVPPIAAKGRIYVATDNSVAAFSP